MEGLKNSYMERFRLIHILSRENPGLELFKGRIDKEKCIRLGRPSSITKVRMKYLFVVEEMINSVSQQLEDEGIAKEKIHFELFTSPLGKLQAKKKNVVQKEDHNVEVVLTLDGDVHEFKMNGASDNILDAARKQELMCLSPVREVYAARAERNCWKERWT